MRVVFFRIFALPSCPRQRESSHSLKGMNTRVRGYDEFKGLAKILRYKGLKYYPSSILAPTSAKKTANTFFRISVGRVCASFAPSGAENMLAAATPINAGP